MNKLESARKKIDSIDKKVIKLYEKRMEAVKQVVDFKISNDMPVLDSGRETDMFEKNLELIKNPELRKYYKDVLQGFLKASKDMQNDILIKN